MASIGDDREWVIQQFEYLYGRPPTANEVNHHVDLLQGGMSRSAWMTSSEKISTQAKPAVVRIFEDVLGRAPTPSELKHYSTLIIQGRLDRQTMRKQLASGTEALLREPEEPPDPTKENAKTLISATLAQMGLTGMDDWVMEQLENDYSEERVLMNLRETEQHKARFGPAMEARKAAGLPFVDEATIIAYEGSVRQLMHAAGMPVGFYDEPQDFADFIGKDISPTEMSARINDGYLAASQAPPEIKAELRDLYGIDESGLAAYFLDPDRALPVLQRQWTAAQVSGQAQLTGYGRLNVTEAERLASLGVTAQQAQEGFGALTENEELFGALPGEQDGLITREEQMGAVFGGDARARAKVEQKAGARRSAGSGAQAFGLSQGGVAGLSRR